MSQDIRIASTVPGVARLQPSTKSPSCAMKSTWHRCTFPAHETNSWKEVFGSWILRDNKKELYNRKNKQHQSVKTKNEIEPSSRLCFVCDPYPSIPSLFQVSLLKLVDAKAQFYLNTRSSHSGLAIRPHPLGAHWWGALFSCTTSSRMDVIPVLRACDVSPTSGDSNEHTCTKNIKMMTWHWHQKIREHNSLTKNVHKNTNTCTGGIRKSSDLFISMSYTTTPCADLTNSKATPARD